MFIFASVIFSAVNSTSKAQSGAPWRRLAREAAATMVASHQWASPISFDWFGLGFQQMTRYHWPNQIWLVPLLKINSWHFSAPKWRFPCRLGPEVATAWPFRSCLRRCWTTTTATAATAPMSRAPRRVARAAFAARTPAAFRGASPVPWWRMACRRGWQIFLLELRVWGLGVGFGGGYMGSNPKKQMSCPCMPQISWGKPVSLRQDCCDASDEGEALDLGCREELLKVAGRIGELLLMEQKGEALKRQMLETSG